jgi:AcrR family transcriptional regulator
VDTPLPLPQIGPGEERSDAARNRERILYAAERLFNRDGVACTTMDAIAAEAGVGKGTLFRRFGGRAALALAVLESSEREFQEAFIRGPAPLGPGAPARERLIAFGRALLRHVAAHGDLFLAAETAGAPGARLSSGVWSAYRTHVTMLIRETNAEIDADYTAEALLAPLAAEVVLHQLQVPELTLARIGDGWEVVARRVLG